MDEKKDLLISVLFSVLFGGGAAAIAAVRKKINVGQSLVAVAAGCLCSSSAPFVFMALGVHWAWSIPTSAFVGFIIFGIFSLADNTEKQVSSLDVISWLPAWLANKLKKPDGEKR